MFDPRRRDLSGIFAKIGQQIVHEVGGGLVTMFGIFGGGFAQDLVEARIVAFDRRESCFDVVAADIELGFSFKRGFSGDHLEQCDTHRIDIAAHVEFFTHDLFG